jgi:hypothetical protein
MLFIVPLGSRTWTEDLDRGFLHADLGIRRDLEADVGVRQARDAAEHAAGGDHLVAFLQRLDHCLLLLGALHLRPDHEEVQQHEHQDDRQEADVSRVAAGRGLGER